MKMNNYRRYVRRKKTGYFTVRLTISVHPPAPYGQLFVIFCGVLFTLYCDYMCSETDFTQKNAKN